MDHDDIPRLHPPHDTPPIHTTDDLLQHWRALMGPLGFSERLLWFILIDGEGRPVPTVSQIADLPALPDELFVGNLIRIFAEVLDTEPGRGSVAVLLSRPGRDQITDSDRAWGRGLVDTAAQAQVRMWPPHLANDLTVRAFTPDDLTVRRSA